MIRAVGYLLVEAFWTLVFRIAPPQRWEEDDQSTADQVAARTRWVRERRPPDRR